MVLQVTNKARESGGYTRHPLFYNKRSELTTVNDIEKEYWTTLMYFANVPDVALGIMKTKSPQTAKSAHKVFSAYIKQAKVYYDSAKSLDNRASSLSYYYCFMNLAKAAIICQKPSLKNEKFVHGLSGNGDAKTGLFNRTSTVYTEKTSDGRHNLFALLYALYNQQPIPNHYTLRLEDLMSYCSEGAYQLQLATGALSKQLPVFLSVQSKKTENGVEFWPLVAIHGDAEFRKLNNMYAEFLKLFESVEVDQHTGRAELGVYAGEHNQLAYYQSKKVFIEEPNADFRDVASDELKKAIGNRFYPVYFDDPFDFYLSLPLNDSDGVVINECLATYVILHHLSELVRYYPHYMEGALHSKDAWALDSLLDTCSNMFLRGITARIAKDDFRYKSR